ncbi:uncharacterized protein KIAA1755-like [Acipenser ruthenus]|uniref:uncharacterized protein KIAA1755-like n=1 Tax=Acipenser ruthenus TaxID=7906 RepID=UPI0027409F6B|nr:uncharacterized protein KIAA1755-like [Acipenser ruthenus]
MNPASLDTSIQSVLSALYPPFDTTAPTVLSQLFRVIEGRYQGDALRCLLDFLIPVKHILESVQQAACAPYSDVLFRCEGWPLCLHDRVVIQLASVNTLLLRPGDFYLQVKPFREQSARIVLKSLLEDLQEVEETPIPETSYPSIFTRDWLDEINQGRHGPPLHTCLLSTDQGIVKVPWAQVATPEFIDKPKVMASSPATPERSEAPQVPARLPSKKETSGFSVETRILPAKDGIAVSLRLIDSNCGRLIKVDQTRATNKPIGWVSPNTWDSRNQDLEGDYVDLVEFSKGGHHPSDKALPKTNRTVQAPQWTKQEPPPFEPVQSPPAVCGDPIPCGRSIKFSAEPCTPCLRRKMGQDLELQELRCRYRESYMAALQNPVNFESGTMKVTVEESGHLSGSSASICDGGPQPEPSPCCKVVHEHRSPCTSDSVASVSWREPGERQSKSGAHPSPPASDRKLHTGSGTPSASIKCLSGQKTLTNISDRVSVVPALHVAPCKKTTSFGLLSPKVDRHKMAKRDASPTCTAQADASLAGAGSEKGPQDLSVDRPRTAVTRRVAPATSQGPCSQILHSGIMCLPGSRDKAGRAVVQVCSDHTAWRSAATTSTELSKLLLYFNSIPRKDVRERGMTIVVDARKQPPPLALYKALSMAQEQVPRMLHCVLVLVDKETGTRLERQPGLPVEVLTSLKALHKFIDGSQLTAELDGSLPYSHSDWLQLPQKLDPFFSDLREASSLLHKAIRTFESNKRLDTVQDVQQCIQEQKTMMMSVLQDARLVGLQREGGAILARLKKEETRLVYSEDYRDAMDAVTMLYNQLEERVHMLVMKSNKGLQHLDFLLKLRELEGRFNKIREWFDAEGEKRLLEADSVEDSLDRVEQTLHHFNQFLDQATEQQHKAMALVTEAEKVQGSSYPEAEVFRMMVYTFKSGLADFLTRAQECRAQLETMVNLYRFCEKATQLAKDCRQFLEKVNPCNGSATSLESLKTLEKYRLDFTAFSAEQFQQVKVQAYTLKGSRGMRIWNVAWLKCQEVRQQLEERLQDIQKAQQSRVASPEAKRPVPAGPAPLAPTTSEGPENLRPVHQQHPVKTPKSLPERRKYQHRENDYANVTCFKLKFKPDSKDSKGPNLKKEAAHQVSNKTEVTTPKSSGEASKGLDFARVASPTCEWFSWQQGLVRSLSEESSASCSLSSHTDPLASPSTRIRGHPSRKILEAAQQFQISRHGSFCSEDSCSRPTGDCTVDLTRVSSLPAASPRVPQTLGTAGDPGPSEPGEHSGNYWKLQCIMEELLLTERDYVRSLEYIITHYFPEMERLDLPQDLRGQRGLIFGNLEKLYDFHRHFFLKELEGSLKEPLRVGRSFLRHKESFGLYALYSKNKPRSDALLINYAQDFFKNKQLELGDKMDLLSYLLKPVQRISKYNLLLQDMVKECGPERGQERAELQAALEVVRFQLRHGNDLLAMDDIHDCDVNMKEQGQLIRQDEFLVSYRKRKCFRHIFLFQDLILFSKTKKTDVGNDVYLYKQSFKTSDIGMTHNAGDSGLCFEIWFRRRKSQDTYTFQAASAEVKDAWTKDLERILWEQALRNREVRMQERVFMGIGSKPFMDIKHSEAAISDRAINCVPAGKECKTLPPAILPASYEHLLSQRPNSIGSGSSASSSGSHSSSSSGRGSLPPHGYYYSQSRQGEASQGCYRALGGLEEDELDNEAEPLHLLLDSSESSGESISGFSSSDHSCLSVVGGEAEETSSVSSLCSKPSPSPEPQHDFIRRAPHLHYKPRSSSATTPEIKTAAQHAGTNKPDGALSGCSTEV